MQGQSERASHISSEMDSLGETVNRVHDLTQKLTERLSGILRPAVPRPSTVEEAKENQPIAPLAEELQHNRKELLLAEQKLEDLLNRIEL